MDKRKERQSEFFQQPNDSPKTLLIPYVQPIIYISKCPIKQQSTINKSELQSHQAQEPPTSHTYPNQPNNYFISILEHKEIILQSDSFNAYLL